MNKDDSLIDNLLDLTYNLSMDDLIDLIEKPHQKFAEPLVKWAGGKTQLLDRIIPRMPKSFNNYFEPFIGGGALFLNIQSLQPKNAIINDINQELINMYIQVRDYPNEVMTILSDLDSGIISGGKEYYYSAREKFNSKISNQEYDIEMSALFIFINKHCFNGLYRVNSKGLFNVPYNNSIVHSFNKTNVEFVSFLLKSANILCGDFSNACVDATKDDFVFFDSPYAPLKDDSFESYTKEGFSKENHIRLSELFKELTDKGCYCMLTNHNTPFVNELYNDFNIEVVPVKRFINSDASNRNGEEVIITNYSL